MRFDYPIDVVFSCSKCGLCCGDTKQKKRRILLVKSDAQRIATKTKRQISTFATESANQAPYVYEMQKNPDDGKCVFLRNNECNVYADRPLICRFYPFELSTDEHGVYKFRVTGECPGVFRPDTLGVEKKLEPGFFRALLKLACAEFDIPLR